MSRAAVDATFRGINLTGDAPPRRHTPGPLAPVTLLDPEAIERGRIRRAKAEAEQRADRARIEALCHESHKEGHAQGKVQGYYLGYRDGRRDAKLRARLEGMLMGSIVMALSTLAYALVRAS